MLSAEAELSKSSVTVSCVIATGPRKVSPVGWCDLALGCPRQFESVADLQVNLHPAPTSLRVAWTYHLRGCKGFNKCTLRKESCSNTDLLQKPCYDFYFL